MGTVKIDSKPQRSSELGAAQPSSMQRKSKLPKLASSGTRGRSGSLEPPATASRMSAALGTFKTPRSKSNNRTPNSNRQPLSNLHPNSAMRYSMTGGKRSSIYGNAATHNKENRPLADPKWQRDMIRDLIKFCEENGIANQVKEKDFKPLTSGTFRNVFEFLYGFLVPGYQLANPKVTPLHEVLLDILKKLKYPGQISVSHLKTTDGPSRPHFCGILNFFHSLAEMVVNVSTKDSFHMLNFQDVDDDGFVIDRQGGQSKAEIEYNHFMTCYKGYNHGQDEFAKELDDLYWDLLDCQGINQENMQQLEQELQDLKQEKEDLKADMGDLDVLNNKSASVASDIRGLGDYIEKLNKSLQHRKADIKATRENLIHYDRKIEELKANIEILEADCLAKGIDKESSSHVTEVVMTLQARVETNKMAVNEAEKQKWQKEQVWSKQIATLDKLRSDFNRLLITLDIDENDCKKIKTADMNDVHYLLQGLNNALKEDCKRIKKNVEDLRQNYNDCMAEIDKKSKEEMIVDKELSKCKAEYTCLKNAVAKEDEELSRALKLAKEKLENFFRKKHGLRQDLKEKEVQLDTAMRENKQVEAELKKVRKEANEFLKEQLEWVKKSQAQEIKEREAAFKRYGEYSEALCKVLRQERQKMEEKLAQMKKQ